jgi:hypothetical protein
MKTSDYKKMLDEMRSQYLEVLHRRDKLTQELKGIAKSIEGLSALTGDKSAIPDPSLPLELVSEVFKSWIKYMGFADACRAVLRIAPSGITPIELRDTLAIVGFPIEERTNAIVSVHVFLERAIKAEEVEQMNRQDGEKAYRWLWKNELTPTPSVLDRYKEYEKLIKTWKAFGHEHMVPLSSMLGAPLHTYDNPDEGDSLDFPAELNSQQFVPGARIKKK